MPGFPSEDDFSRNNSFDQQHHVGPANHHVPADSAAATDKPIPIRVVHERTGASPQTPKNRLNASSRNTTEIPTPVRTNASESNNIQSEKSPRLERAHSEPPKLFNQRIRAGGASSPGGAPQQAYSTIPENSEPVVVGGSPRFATAPEMLTPNHKLSSSASAPSVPATSQNRPSSAGTPVAPPRRATLQQQQQNREREEEKQQQQQVPQQQQPEAPKVRHIPIFVEGRDEPVTQRKTSQTDIGGGGFRQPSEFYPQNVQKVRSQSVSSPGPSGGSGIGGGGFVRGAGGLNLKPMQPQQQPPLEPTSPLSPIPSDQPIPMGCSGDYFVKSEAAPKPEPTSPAPLPPGPIPMPYTADSVDAPAPEVVHHVPVKVIDTPDPSPPKPEQQQQPKPTDVELSPAEAKLRKIESEVADLLQRVEKFSGGKRDKEYLFLDDLLTQKLCLLDSIESDGREDIRKMRKDSIKNITRCLSMLDRRATASAPSASTAGVTQADGSDDAAQVTISILFYTEFFFRLMSSPINALEVQFLA